jgi:hypothetical protein
MGRVNLHNKYFKTLEVYETDNEIVLTHAANVGVTKGWDNLPQEKHTAAVLIYRGNDIWYFERRRVRFEEEVEDEGDLIGVYEAETDNEYRCIRFPNGAINAEVETYAWQFTQHQKLAARYVYVDPFTQEKKIFSASLN